MEIVPRQPKKTLDVSRGRGTGGDAIKTLIGVIVFLTVVYLLLGWFGILISKTIPDRWEKKLNVTSALENPNGGSLERPQRILDQLMRGKTLRDLDYRLFWLAKDVPNAVCLLYTSDAADEEDV